MSQTALADRPVCLPHITGALHGLRIAIVHEWLTVFAGSEKVLEQMLLLFPNADLFALVDHLPADQRRFLNGKSVRTSFLQNLPFSARLFRKLLWIMPSAIESLDLSNYDIILSSSHAVAKGVITGPDQLHICYCHSPMRYAWDLQHEYLRQAGLHSGIMSIYARTTLHYLRLWDVRTANGVDHFIANSNFIARRIKKVYGRESTVIHPPVETDLFPFEEQKEEYYLTASRLVPYKRIDLIIEAFSRTPQRKLRVIGDGPEMQNCKRLAGPNIEFLGYQSDQVLRSLMSRARAFVFAAEEDFGIVVVEAQACGTPVICFGRGGSLDSVVRDHTGVYFERQTVNSIVDAVDRFENLPTPLNSVFIRSHAERFSSHCFRFKLMHLVESLWSQRVLSIGPADAGLVESAPAIAGAYL
jgi:glycosyltransferase involved in cell wall biosynthesis